LDRVRRAADDGGVRERHRAAAARRHLGLDSWVALLIYALGVWGLLIVSG
jgi:hypothetical protein